MFLQNNKKYFLFFIILITLNSCELPPASYIINTPLGFSCSTNFDIKQGSNAENLATWSQECDNTDKTWLRFSVYASQKDISGFIFYKTDKLDTPYADFKDMVVEHIVNETIFKSDNIINFIADETCSSKDPSGLDRGQEFPSISLTYPTRYTTVGFTIQGMNTVANKQTSIIIPPLICLGTGSFVVTTVDYINNAESQASNILKLTAAKPTPPNPKSFNGF